MSPNDDGFGLNVSVVFEAAALTTCVIVPVLDAKFATSKSSRQSQSALIVAMLTGVDSTASSVCVAANRPFDCCITTDTLPCPMHTPPGWQSKTTNPAWNTTLGGPIPPGLSGCPSGLPGC